MFGLTGKNWVCYFMQIVSFFGDNLHKVSNPILWEILGNISKWLLLVFYLSCQTLKWAVVIKYVSRHQTRLEQRLVCGKCRPSTVLYVRTAEMWARPPSPPGLAGSTCPSSPSFFTHIISKIYIYICVFRNSSTIKYITKTRLFTYIENFTAKKGKFSD